MLIVLFLISLSASAIGAVCGIGGGIIIKPALDFFGVADVATASFLSGCTVFIMSAYTVGAGFMKGGGVADTRKATLLALGAVAGGAAGNELFLYVLDFLGGDDVAGAAQSGGLLLVTLGALLYTLRKEGIRTRHAGNAALCIGVGFVLGAVSGFLGIGGGPVNLVLLYYFFSMEAKEAARNSLYIIFFGQMASLLHSLASHNVPPVAPAQLILMAMGGLLGGVMGLALHHRLTDRDVHKLFIGLMTLIVCVCLHNLYHFVTIS